MRKHGIRVFIIWALLTAAGEALALTFSPTFPVAASEQAKVVDDAFQLMTLLSVPLFAFVVAMLFYSAIVFRRTGQPDGDGPPIKSSRRVTNLWILVTTALTIAVIIHPGITGILELRADDDDIDLVVQVEARRFFWNAIYPEQNVQSNREMVLPIDHTIRFVVSSHDDDVLHSFGVPVFRVKIDAVPGTVTGVTATPTKLGTYGDDENFRLQCAELCGVGHTTMKLPVRVVERTEFDQWISEQKPIATRR
jgi:cytochrome c oxidase subunit 2